MAGLTFNIFGHDVSGSKSLKSVGDEAERQSGRIAGTFKKAGVAIGISLGAAVAGVAAVFKTGLDEQSDFLKGQGQLAAGLKSTGNAAGTSVGHLEDLASAIQNYSGQTDDSIVESEQLLLTFTNIKNAAGKNNDVLDQTVKLTADMAARMGTDAKSSAILLGKALNDPVKNLGALTRVGVSFSDGQIKQIKAFEKSGKTMKAQQVILKELNKEFGGSAKAAGDTLPGQLTRAKRAFEDVSQSVLSAMMPVLVRLANIVTKYLMPAFEKVVAWVLAHWPSIQKVIIAAWSKYVQPVFEAIVEFVKDRIIPALKDAVDFVVKHWPQIKAVFVTVWKNIKPVIDAFVRMMQTLWTSVLQPIVRWVQSHWPQIQAVMRGVFIAIAVAAKILLVAIQIAFDLMAVSIKVFAAVVGWLLNSVIVPVFNGIKAVIGGAITYIKAQIAIGKAVFEALRDTAGAATRGIKSAFTSTKNWVRDRINDIVGFVKGIPGKIAGAGQGLFNAGKSLMGKLFDGLSHATGVVGDFAKAVVNKVIDGLNTLIPHKLHIHIPIPLAPDVNMDIPLIPRIPHLAQGSGFFRGGTALVGDRGPELVNLPPGAKVTPHSALMSQARMGGGAQEININVRVEGGLATEAGVQRAVAAALVGAVNSQGVRLNIAKGIA